TPCQNGIAGSTITTSGNGLLSLYDGAKWNLYTSTELSLSLTLTSGSVYDVFVYDNSGLTLETVVWTNTTTRATALDLQDGILCKHGALTHRYVGTIYASGTNVIEDSLAKRYLVNYYNRVWKLTNITDSSGYSKSSTTLGQIGSNQINIVTCVGDYSVRTEGLAVIQSAAAAEIITMTIGSGTTTEATGAVRAANYNIGTGGN